MGRHVAFLGLLLATAAPAWARPSPVRSPASWASTLPAHLIAPARVAINFGVITSVVRTHEHNRRVGGVANSHHLYGRALDVARRPGVPHRMVDDALRRAGFRLIESLDEGDHSHFAFAPGVAPMSLASIVTPVAVGVKDKVPSPPVPSPLLADHHGTLMVATPRLPGETGIGTAAVAGVLAAARR